MVNPTTKIIATADLHGCQGWYDWLLEKAPACDLAIVAGDLVEAFAAEKGEQIPVLQAWMEKFLDTVRTA